MQYDGSHARWIVLSLVFCFVSAEGFTKACFGQISDIMKQYFSVGIQTIDWFTLTSSVSSAVMLLFMSYQLSTTVSYKTRRVALMSSGSLACAFAFLVLAWVFKFRECFMLVIVGQIFSGWANASNYVLAGLVATTWFSESDWLLVLAVTLAGRECGLITGFLMPCRTLPNPIVGENGNMSADISEKEAMGWSHDVSIAMACMFSSILTAVIILGFVCFIFVYDPVRKNQENDQGRTVCNVLAVEVSTRTSLQENSVIPRLSAVWGGAWGKTISWCVVSRSLLKKGNLAALVMFFSTINAMNITWYILAHDMISSDFSTSSQNTHDASALTPSVQTGLGSFSTKSGFAMAMLSVGSMTCGILTSKMLRYKWVCLYVGGIGMTVSLVALFLCLQAFAVRFSEILIFMASYGVFMSMARVASISLAIQIHSNIDRIHLICWINLWSSVLEFLLPMCGRKAFEVFGTVGCMTFQLLQAFISLISFLFI